MGKRAGVDWGVVMKRPQRYLFIPTQLRGIIMQAANENRGELYSSAHGIGRWQVLELAI